MFQKFFGVGVQMMKMIAFLGFLLIGTALARPDVSHLKDHHYGHYNVHEGLHPSHGAALKINEQHYELPSVHHQGVLSHGDGHHYGVLSHADGHHHGVLTHVDGQHHGVLSHVGGQHQGILSHVDEQHHGVYSHIDGQHYGVQSHVGGQHQGVLSHVDGQHQGILSYADGQHHGGISHLGGIQGAHHDGVRVVEHQEIQRHGGHDEGVHVVSNEHLHNDGQRVLVKSVHTEQHQEVPQRTEVRYQLPSTSYGVPLTDKYGQVSVHSNFPSNLQSTYYTPANTNIYNKDYYDSGKVEEEKHVYYFSAPETIEDRPRLRIHLTPFHKKNTNIVFVKVPEYANPIPEVVAPPSDFEDKTKVYVLVKNNKENEPVVYTAPAPAKSLKPEVFVYKYKNENDLQTVLSGGRDGQSVGTGVYQHNDEQSFFRSIAESRAGLINNDKYSGVAARYADTPVRPIVSQTVVTKEQNVPQYVHQHIIPSTAGVTRTVVTKEATVPSHHEHHDSVSSLRSYNTQNSVPSSGIATYKTYTTQNSEPVVNEQVTRTVVTNEETVPAHYAHQGGVSSSLKTFESQSAGPVVHQQVVPSSGISTYKTYTTQNSAPVVNEQVTRTVVTKEETAPAHYAHQGGVSSSLKTFESQSAGPVVHQQVVPPSGISTYKTYTTQNSAPVVNEQVTRTFVTKEATVPAQYANEGVFSQGGASSQIGQSGLATFKTISTENVAPSVTRTIITKEETLPSGVAFQSFNTKRSTNTETETTKTATLKDEKKTDA